LAALVITSRVPCSMAVAPQHFPTQLFIKSGPITVAGKCAGGRAYCLGGFDAGEECSTLGGQCAGSCAGGTWIAKKYTCSGTCECSDAGVATCVEGIGESGQKSCECEAPNTNARCDSNAVCTGEGVCGTYGTCQTANTGGECASTFDCSGSNGAVTAADGSIDIWPGASQSCIPSIRVVGNESHGVVYGGEPFGPLVVALKDAAYRTTDAGDMCFLIFPCRMSAYAFARGLPVRLSIPVRPCLHCNSCRFSVSRTDPRGP